eukprot:200704_1
MAFHFASDSGCVLEIDPKYLGILNSTKFIQLSNIFEDYDSDTRLFFGRRCAIQINNIWLSDDRSLKKFILPLSYLEKLMLQTIFDRQFFNAKNLYDDYDRHSNRSLIQHRLLNIILSCTSMTLYEQNNKDAIDKETQMMIIGRYFPYVSLREREEIRYIVKLLEHWCKKRTFITFESFPAEIPFMIKPLKDYFISRNSKHEPYSIHIANLQFIMPNLKNYRNFNKHVMTLHPVPAHNREVRAVSNSIINIIDSNLTDLYRYHTKNKSHDVKFRAWCDQNGYNDKYVTNQIKRFAHCNKNILRFVQEIFDIPTDKHAHQLLQKATKPYLLTIVYGDCKDLNPSLSLPDPVSVDEHRHSRSASLIYGTSKYHEHDAIYRVLSNCLRHEIPDQICDMLEKLGFWKRTSMSKGSFYQIKKEIAT